MIAYRYDESTKYYLGTQECQLDPIASEKAGEEIYLLPANCTYIVPLEPKEGFYVKWSGSEWVYEEIPVEPEPEPHIPTTEEKIAQLDAQYSNDTTILQKYYISAMIANDTETMAEIKQELADLGIQYDKELEEIEKED